MRRLFSQDQVYLSARTLQAVKHTSVLHPLGASFYGRVDSTKAAMFRPRGPSRPNAA